MRTVRRSSWEQGIRINYVAPCYIKSAIRTAENERALVNKGVEFGFPEDVAHCMMRIACDRTMNGEYGRPFASCRAHWIRITVPTGTTR